jgi:hypothetical protein
MRGSRSTAPGRRALLAAALLAAASLPGAPARAEDPVAAPAKPAAGETVSAFRFATDVRVKASIDLGLVRRGTPAKEPRDAIPAIRRPASLPAREASHVRDADPVVGVVLGGEARAYPVRMLQQHEVVNDALGGVAVAVTYCPLCDAATAWRRWLEGRDGAPGRALTLGVSGYLYESDVLLYDAETESFWAQILGLAVVGPLTGTGLAEVPVVRATWGAWKALHPDTTALSWRTEYGWPPEAYAKDTYAEYAKGAGTSFPVSVRDRRLPMKALVHGVVAGKASLAVAASLLSGRGEPLAADVGGRAVRFLPSREGGPVRAEAKEAAAGGEERWTEVPVATMYWFAWYAFHRDTAVVAGEPEAGTSSPGAGR